MANQEVFWEKLLKRLDRIDRVSLEQHVLNITKAKDFAYDVLNVMPEGIVIINQQGLVTFCNTTARNVLMRSASEDKISYQNIFTDKRLLEFVQSHFTHSHRIMNAAVEILLPKPMRLLVSLIPLYDSKNNIMQSYLVILHDCCVDDEIDAARQHDNIESLVKLSAGIAHEIGNPLNTINIYLQLILDGIKSGKQEKITEWISIISDETKRIDKLVKNFLNVTRSRVALFKKGDINRCVEEALKFLRPEIQHQNISLDVALDGDIPQFFIDSEKIYKACINIIKNAIEAMPHGGDLAIKSSKKDNIVSVMFKDTGIGISEDDITHIFDAYFTTKQQGSGLGLMNVYNIIKAHQGRVHVQSKQNGGTIVILTLPFRREKLQLPHIKAAKSVKKGRKE